MIPTLILLVSVIVLLLIGGLVLFFKKIKSLGSLSQKHVYQDSFAKSGEILYSKTLPLMGKPDFIIEKNGEFIPVEFKSGKTPETPYNNHIAQLISYCYLVEEQYAKRPSHGIIRYPEKEFEIEYTDQLKALLTKTVQEILSLKQNNNFEEQKETLFREFCKKCRQEFV